MSRSVPPSELPKGDYSAVEAMVKEMPLGRWFLDEHAKRHTSDAGGSAVEALSKLSEFSSAGADTERLEEVLDLIAGARGDPANDRSARSAETGIAAIRQVIEKIREVAFELREASKLDIYASALEFYCTDMLGATDAQENAIHRVGDLSAFLHQIERSIAETTGREVPEEAQDEASAPALREPVAHVTAELIKDDAKVADEKPAQTATQIPTEEPDADLPTATDLLTDETRAASEGTETASPTGPTVADLNKAPPPETAEVTSDDGDENGERNAMNEADTASHEPAPFEPSKTPRATNGAAGSASSKLVKEARALFFVNPN